MRRRTLLAGGSALVLAAAGGAAWRMNLLGRSYPPTPYDDVLGRLRRREQMAAFGALALKSAPDFMPDAAAARLRALLGRDGLEMAARRDAAEGRVTEAAHWLAPESMALMAMLAATAARPG